MTERDSRDNRPAVARKGVPLTIFLAIFGLIVALPALIFGATLLSRYADLERSRVAAQIHDVASNLANRLDSQLSNSITTLSVLAGSPLLESATLGEFHARVADALSGTNDFVLLLDPSGQQLVNTRVPYGSPLGKSSDPSLSEITDNRPYVTNAFFGKVAEAYVFNIVYPIVHDDELRYFLVLTRDASDIDDWMNLENVDPQLDIVVVDGNGVVMFQDPNHGTLAQGSVLPERLKALATGRNDIRSRWTREDGTEFLVMSNATRLADWSVVLQMPVQAFNETANQTWLMLSIGGAVLLGLTVLFAFLFGRALANPFTRIGQQARAVGEFGEIHAVNSWLREINELNVALERAALKRDRRTAQIELLMRELAHRAKNQLTVVQSVARLIARRSTSIEDFNASFLPRIEALSRSIDVLASRDWSGAELKDLIDAHLHVFDGTEGARYRLEGPPILLKSSAVERLGMALHELATNASKYGALSRPGGIVDVTWRIERGEEADRLNIVWREKGGPKVEEPAETGFGSILIGDMIRSSLKADVTADYRRDGLVWTMTCNLDEAVDLSSGTTR